MIKAVFGLPGEGKTTFLTKCAVKWLNGKKFMGIPANERVFTSFYCPGCYKLEWDKLGLYELQNANILIDEIMLFCDNRNWKEFPDHLKIFFSMARHWNVNILWCSQNYRDCDLKIRNLTQNFYLIQKSKLFPSVSFVKPIIRKFGVSNETIVDTYELAAPLEWTIVYRPHYYKFFDSYSKHKNLPKTTYQSWDDTIDTVEKTEEIQDQEEQKTKYAYSGKISLNKYRAAAEEEEAADQEC